MTEPRDVLAAALLPIVGEWFDTGYEAGKLDTAILAERIAAMPDHTLVSRAELERLRAALEAALVLFDYEIPFVGGERQAAFEKCACELRSVLRGHR